MQLFRPHHLEIWATGAYLSTPTRSKPNFDYRHRGLVRSYVQWRANREELRPCVMSTFGRPVFQSELVLHGNVKQDWLNRASLRSLGDELKPATWASESLHRMHEIGLPLNRTSGLRIGVKKGRAMYPDNKAWSHPAILREGCKTALKNGVSIVNDIEARILCAEIKDERYPTIYRSLEKQANMLYLAGRLDLERKSTFRILALYMLSVAAGIGHLDAALLLHQLEKIDSSFILPREIRDLIVRAAVTQVDWRSMVAHAETMITDTKRRGRMGKMPQQTFEQCVELLTKASKMTHPVPNESTNRKEPPPGYIDVDQLEAFDPPHKIMIDLLTSQSTGLEISEELWDQVTDMLSDSAVRYNDAATAWECAGYITKRGQTGSKNWVKCVEIAANDANPAACFDLAKYYFQRDRWYPSIASTILDRINAQKEQHRQRFQDPGSPNLHKDLEAEESEQHFKKGKEEINESAKPILNMTEQDKHDLILNSDNNHLTPLREGFRWMTIAAQIYIDSPTKMLNRYCIMAGLLRQNGFLAEGRHTLQEAKVQLQDCVGDAREKSRAIQVLDEYLDHWDSRLMHHLLTPSDVRGLLDTKQK